MRTYLFPASARLDLSAVLKALRSESFAVANIAQGPNCVVVYLLDSETRNPGTIVEWFIQEQARIAGNPPINIVTAVSRPHFLPKIHRSMEESAAGTGANVVWILVFDAPGEMPEPVLHMMRDASRIKIRRLVYPDGRARFGIPQKNLGMGSIKDGFFHCLDDDNLVHPDFFRGIMEAISANPGKRAFAFHQQRWDKHGDLRAAPENMRKFHIDNTMFVVHKDLIGSDRYDQEKAGEEDFYFFRKLYDKDPDAFVFLDETLAYYNYLACLSPDAYDAALAVALVTVPRPEGYIKQTISSLEDSGFFLFHRDLPLRLVAGGLDTSHIERLKAKPTKFMLDPLEDAEAAKLGFHSLDRKQRCAFGHLRAMRHLLSAGPGWDTALIIEDDVRFAKGWRRYLDRVVSAIRRIYGERWMLTLYRIDHAHQKGTLAEHQKGRTYYEPDESAPFWGTQAIVYPRETLKLMPESLIEGCIKRFVQPVDITLGDFAKRNGIPILVSVPSLVQHIGDNTTGQSSWFHQAECFLESVEELG
jgi:hypothetical protein